MQIADPHSLSKTAKLRVSFAKTVLIARTTECFVNLDVTWTMSLAR